MSYAKVRKIPRPVGRIFLMSDIHGCYDQFVFLLDSLFNQKKFNQDDLLIFLGDYVDRGPSTRSVLEKCIKLQEGYPNVIFLRGNHEDMMLSFLGKEGKYGESWVTNGGNKVISEYMNKLWEDLSNSGEAWEFESIFPPRHLEFLESLEYLVYTNEYIFVHAGIQVYNTLDRQNKEPLVWTRDNFVRDIRSLPEAENILVREEKVVIHGHTPNPEVLFDLPFRINIDSGGVFGGQLCLFELNYDNPADSTLTYVPGVGPNLMLKL